MRILITGAAGFTGTHLWDYLKKIKNHEIYGLEKAPKNRQDGRFYCCDLCDARQTAHFLKKINPDRIFHLAAQSSAALSWDKPKETFNLNVGGTLNLLEAVRAMGKRPAFLVSGSAEEYGLSAADRTRTNESAILKPFNPYAASKVAQRYLAFQYSLVFGFKFVHSAGFNLAGPGQNEKFVVSNFARQVALIEAGRQEAVIRVGHLEAVRDFTDVRDAVRAHWLLLEKGRPGESYNICTGKARKIREILDIYLSFSRIKIKIQKDAKRLRAGDVSRLVGDPGKLMKQTGWRPEISFEQTLRDVLNYWRKHVYPASPKKGI